MTTEKLGREPSERLLLNVAQLLKEHVGSRRSYAMDEIISEQASVLVKGKVVLIRTNQGILVQGEFSAALELTCSRCLRNFPVPLVSL